MRLVHCTEKTANKSNMRKACGYLVSLARKNETADKDNVYSASKYILDSMQECGVLKNDNNRYIKGIFNSIVYDGTDGVDVKIYSVDEYEQFLKEYFEQIKESIK